MNKAQARALAAVARIQAEALTARGMPLADDDALARQGIDPRTLDELRTAGFIDYAEARPRYIRIIQRTPGRSMVTGYRLTVRGWDTITDALVVSAEPALG